MNAEWISVHPSQLAQFGELYGDGSTSHWFGRPLTGVPAYGGWDVKPGTIRVHTDSGDLSVPWNFATGVPQWTREWREPEAPLPPAEPVAPEREDRAPRRRNPRIGCEQPEPGGTWIHGSPHDCPRWVRG